ncbi:MAG: hypothetical protein JO258_15315 [Alphaproteobacteria bacterium]|nr:hypothetical protein [Alphaproteobacteria bacterium]
MALDNRRRDLLFLNAGAWRHRQQPMARDFCKAIGACNAIVAILPAIAPPSRVRGGLKEGRLPTRRSG